MSYLQRNKFFRNIIYKIKNISARERVRNIKPYINKQGKILDIGAGSCIISEILKKEGYDITPIDIKNLSFVESITPILYDGSKIPFEKDKFEISFILTVLHHIPHPIKILEEAKRVSKSILIIEDIYTNTFNKLLVYFFDRLFNFGTMCPHTNKNDKDWKKTFENMGLKLLKTKYYKSFFGVNSVIYYLEK